MTRVVITGMGAITPIGNDLPTYWNNLQNGVSGADNIRRFDTSNHKTTFACEVKNYEGEDYFDRKELRKLDRYSQFALISTEEAVKQAHLNVDTLIKERAGVIWGSGIGGFETFEEQIRDHYLNDAKYNPFFIHKILPDTAAGLISIKYGLMGVNFNSVSACSSAANAIIEAFNYIKWGKADLIIAGGSETPITKASMHGFNAMKALSENNDNYASASKPFDVSRDGFVAGEGSGTLLLESLDHAKRRNVPILAEIIGGGLAADAYHITGTHPDGKGAFLGMRSALEEGGISAQEINYINAHATSTLPGDNSEMKAIEQLLDGKNTQTFISATKSMTGHLLGASGAVEAISVVQSILHNTIPPTINSRQVEDHYQWKDFIVLGKKREIDINYALSNNFGFGGHCASILFKKWTDN